MTGDLFPLPPEEVVGNIAAKQIGVLYQQLEAARTRMLELLKHVGIATACRGPHCGKAIIMVRHHDTGRMTPYDLDGTNHFIGCIDAPMFKAKKESHAG